MPGGFVSFAEYRASLDPSGFKRGSQEVRQEAQQTVSAIDKLIGSFDKAQAATNRRNQQLGRLNRLADLGLTGGREDEAIRAIEDSFNRATTAAGRLENGARLLAIRFGGAISAASAFHFALNSVHEVANLTEDDMQKLGVSIDRNIIARAKEADKQWSLFWLHMKVAAAETVNDITSGRIFVPGFLRDNTVNQPSVGGYGPTFNVEDQRTNALLQGAQNDLNAVFTGRNGRARSPLQKYQDQQLEEANREADRRADEAQRERDRRTREFNESNNRILTQFKPGGIQSDINVGGLRDLLGIRSGLGDRSEQINALAEFHSDADAAWDRYYEGLAEKADDFAQHQEQTQRRSMDRIRYEATGIFEDLFNDIAEDGKLSWESIGRTALRIINQIAAEQLSKSLFGDFGSSSGGSLSSVFSSIGSSFAGLFAEGGTLRPGQWGMAGEHGPEPIFAGAAPLTVFPHGGRGHALTFNIDARGSNMTEEQFEKIIERKVVPMLVGVHQSAVQTSVKAVSAQVHRRGGKPIT